MKTILTAIILLTAISAFAEEKARTDGSQTNNAAVTNAPVNVDARTGATHKRKQILSP